MKKTLCLFLAALMLLGLAACGSEKQEAATAAAPAPAAAAEEGFQPALDPETSCEITVAGGYDNFEALEAEFDRFNEYYPNVGLMYTRSTTSTT